MNDVAMNERLERIEAHLAELAAAQKRREETFDELMPILGMAVTETSNRLQAYEDKGYFEFGKRLLGVADAVVEGFAPEDVEALGNNVVSILDTVKHMTQPKMLQLANDAADAVDDAGSAQPVGVFGMLKASNDEDVKRGLAVAIAILREIGKRAHSASEGRKAARKKLSARLGPSQPRQLPAPKAAKPKAKAKKVAPKKAPTKKVAIEIPGVEMDEEGFLVDWTTWNQDVAMKIAQALGFEGLEEGHWKVIEFARAEYERSGASPNVRKLAGGSGLTTKEIYTLFRVAPGIAAARISGLPKPVGCI